MRPRLTLNKVLEPLPIPRAQAARRVGLGVAARRRRRAGECRDGQRRPEREQTTEREAAAVLRRPQLRAGIGRAGVERAMRTVIACHWRPEVVRPVGILGLLRLLRFVSRPREDAIEDGRRQAIADDRLDGRQPDPKLPSVVIRGSVNRVGRDLGLEDGRHRLRLVRKPALHPAKLRRVHRRQMHRR